MWSEILTEFDCKAVSCCLSCDGQRGKAIHAWNLWQTLEIIAVGLYLGTEEVRRKVIHSQQSNIMQHVGSCTQSSMMQETSSKNQRRDVGGQIGNQSMKRKE